MAARTFVALCLLACCIALPTRAIAQSSAPDTAPDTAPNAAPNDTPDTAPDPPPPKVIAVSPVPDDRPSPFEPSPLSLPPEDPPGPFNQLSGSLMATNTALAWGYGTEWRVGGVLEIGTPGPGQEDSSRWRGVLLRGNVGAAYSRIDSYGGANISLGGRLGYAWTGAVHSSDIAFGAGVLVMPALTLFHGSQRLSVAFEPGVVLRFHVFGLSVGSPLEVGVYGWGDGPWSAAKGSFNGPAPGIRVAAGLWIPGARW